MQLLCCASRALAVLLFCGRQRSMQTLKGNRFVCKASNKRPAMSGQSNKQGQPIASSTRGRLECKSLCAPNENKCNVHTALWASALAVCLIRPSRQLRPIPYKAALAARADKTTLAPAGANQSSHSSKAVRWRSGSIFMPHHFIPSFCCGLSKRSSRQFS